MPTNRKRITVNLSDEATLALIAMHQESEASYSALINKALHFYYLNLLKGSK
jgi:hypothetical protein